MTPYLIGHDVALIKSRSAMPPLLCFHLNKAISPTCTHPINSTGSPHTHLIYCDGCKTAGLKH